MLAEFDRITERGGVLGAMETGYQRGRIQDESMLYEHRKHDGSLPIVGVNTFRNPHEGEAPREVVLARGIRGREGGPARAGPRLQGRAPRSRPRRRSSGSRRRRRRASNVFAVLMDAARVCSLQQVTEAFFEVGGQYRRNV